MPRDAARTHLVVRDHGWVVEVVVVSSVVVVVVVGSSVVVVVVVSSVVVVLVVSSGVVVVVVDSSVVVVVVSSIVIVVVDSSVVVVVVDSIALEDARLLEDGRFRTRRIVSPLTGSVVIIKSPFLGVPGPRTSREGLTMMLPPGRQSEVETR